MKSRQTGGHGWCAALALFASLWLGQAGASTTATLHGSSPAAMPFCSQGAPQTATQNDRVLQFAAHIQKALAAQGDAVALISRSGLQLARFDIRYSHSGVLLQEPAGGGNRWSVRQLYFDCEAARPRIFDQGLAGFLLSAESPQLAHVSVVFVPATAGEQLRERAEDNELARQLLGQQYSANAYPFSTRYQNCNQWVAELLAAAWAPLADGPQLRERAQQWLQHSGYSPVPVQIDSHLTKWLGQLLPLVHLDDHPPQARSGLALQVSLPADLERHVRRLFPQAIRLEFCHNATQLVTRRGWEPLDGDCTPGENDHVTRFES